VVRFSDLERSLGIATEAEMLRNCVELGFQ